jgi:D-amino peptidase
MKIYISTDMEGVGGISSWNEMEASVKGAFCYDLLRSELALAIDELDAKLGHGAVEEICVCDSHSRGEGLVYGSLGDGRVTHIKGYPRPYYMMQGLDASFAAAFLVGYHASIGSMRGGMDHSYSASCIYALRIDGRECGEVEINAFLAGYYGVPIGLVSGDDVLEAELASFYTGGLPYARTKEGIGRFAAKMYSPERVERAIRSAVDGFAERFGSLEVKRPAGETTLEVDLANTVIADAVSVMPGLERVSGRTVRYRSRDYRDIYRMILATTMLGGKFVGYT